MENPELDVLAALEIQHLLATLYQRIEPYPESENLYMESIRNSQNTLGPDDPRTLDYQRSLAGMYCDLQQHTKAEELYLETIKIRKGVSCQDNFHTLSFQSISQGYTRIQGGMQRLNKFTFR